MLDSFYKNVTSPDFTWSVHTIMKFPKGGHTSFKLSPSEDGYHVFSQGEQCPVVKVDCSDLTQSHLIESDDVNCASLELACGHEVSEVFDWDALQELPGQVISNSINSSSQFFSDCSSYLMSSFSSGYSSLTDFISYITPDFSFISSGFNSLSSGVVDYFNSFFAKEKCDWDDIPCHQQALMEELQECKTESQLLSTLNCYMDHLYDYAAQYDASEIIDDIYENYLPDAQTVGMAVVVATAAITAGYIGVKAGQAIKAKLS